MARILIVEDDEITSAVLARLILRAGHEVDVSKNGLVAVEMLEEGNYSLLITDLMMPRLGGQELCEIVRSDARFLDLPDPDPDGRDQRRAAVLGDEVRGGRGHFEAR